MHKLMRGLELAACLLLGTVAALTFVDVIGRYLFAKVLPGGYELNQHLQAIVVFWGLALAFRARSHITVDLVWEKLGAGGRRLLDRISTALTAAAMAALCACAALQLPKMVRAGEVVPPLALPVWPFALAAICGAALACVACMARGVPPDEESVQ